MCCVPAPLTPSPNFFPSCHLLIIYSHHPSCHPSCHPTCHPTRHLPPSPDFSYTTPAHPVTCYACYSCMMHMTTGSTWFFANSLSNRKTSSPHTIVATHFGIVCESSICLSNFYDTLYFILQIISHMFCPPSIRLLCCMQTFLENTYVQLQLNLV